MDEMRMENMKKEEECYIRANYWRDRSADAKAVRLPRNLGHTFGIFKLRHIIIMRASCGSIPHLVQESTFSTKQLRFRGGEFYDHFSAFFSQCIENSAKLSLIKAASSFVCNTKSTSPSVLAFLPPRAPKLSDTQWRRTISNPRRSLALPTRLQTTYEM